MTPTAKLIATAAGALALGGVVGYAIGRALQTSPAPATPQIPPTPSASSATTLTSGAMGSFPMTVQTGQTLTFAAPAGGQVLSVKQTGLSIVANPSQQASVTWTTLPAATVTISPGSLPGGTAASVSLTIQFTTAAGVAEQATLTVAMQ